MKQFKLTGLLLALVAFMLSFSACSDDENREINEFQITVASVQRVMLNADHHSPYFVKYTGDTEWKTFQYITGFSHTEGYEYVLRVRVERVIFEDIIGGSPYETTLLEEISKVKKDSENIPIQKGRFTIASKKTVDANKPFYAKSYQNENWTKFPPIEGFQHEAGYEYVLILDCKYNGMDAEPQYNYSLVATLEKTKQDSVGLPLEY